jgi:Putative prokaryotic signal transducing protein
MEGFMFCPVCEAEYEPGITRCSDDNADLVERLDASTGHDDSEARFLPLHKLGSPVEAEMVNDILRQNGIRSMVKSGGADALSPLLSSTAEGSMVLVDERDFDRAQELYTAFFGEDTTPLTGGEDEDEDAENDDAETR